ncbi:MAG: HD domain-containing protein [Candidatus Micrarchaeota archaeon]
MKAMISELKEGQQVDSLFSVKYKRDVLQYANGWRFAFGASDRTGEVEVSYWGANDEARVRKAHAAFGEGSVVRVVGLVGSYKGRKKIDVNEGKGLIEPAGEYDIADFLAHTAKDVGGMYAELLGMVESVTHPGLKKLLEAFFNDSGFAERFRQAPGAMQMHHAWVGGLLEHTLAVARISRNAAPEYGADLDLVTAGALLHDIGKMREYEVTTNIKIGEEGMLRGHTAIGEETVRRKAIETGLDGQTLLKLSHMILSHHGELSNGAPKTPMFAEAAIVHFADYLDARAARLAQVKREATTEDFRVYDGKAGEVYLR